MAGANLENSGSLCLGDSLSDLSFVAMVVRRGFLGGWASGEGSPTTHLFIFPAYHLSLWCPLVLHCGGKWNTIATTLALRKSGGFYVSRSLTLFCYQSGVEIFLYPEHKGETNNVLVESGHGLAKPCAWVPEHSVWGRTLSFLLFPCNLHTVCNHRNQVLNITLAPLSGAEFGSFAWSPPFIVLFNIRVNSAFLSSGHYLFWSSGSIHFTPLFVISMVATQCQ